MDIQKDFRKFAISNTGVRSLYCPNEDCLALNAQKIARFCDTMITSQEQSRYCFEQSRPARLNPSDSKAALLAAARRRSAASA